MTQNIGEICTNKPFAAKISTTPLPAKKKKKKNPGPRGLN